MDKITAGEFVSQALKLGADDAVEFKIGQIVFDPRTIIKCMFGCDDWGKGHTCPSREGFLKPWEFEKILQKYSWGIIVHSHSKKVAQKVSYELERMAFTAGYYFAFSMSDCALCTLITSSPFVAFSTSAANSLTFFVWKEKSGYGVAMFQVSAKAIRGKVIANRATIRVNSFFLITLTPFF